MSDVELALSVYARHGGGTQGVTAVWYAGYRAGRSDARPRRHAVVHEFLDALDELEASGLTEVWLDQPEVQRGLDRLALLMDGARAPGGAA